MKRSIGFACLAVIAAMIPLSLRARAEVPLPTLPPEPSALTATPQQIDQAIDKARDYLYSRQKAGNWEIAPEYHPPANSKPGNGLGDGDFGGLTAMAAHALLAAGENPNDPRLRPAINQLLKWQMRMCPYALCQRDQVLQLLPKDPAVKDLVDQDGQYLYTSSRSKGEAEGLYFYFPGTDDKYDHSVSQYGVLGMWACGESGFEVPGGYWGTVERAWQHHQDAAGGWSYQYHGGATPSMTAAGVATLFITQDYVHSTDGLDCHGNVRNPAIERGMKWLSDNFSAIFSPASSQVPLAQTYTLYGIERIGVAGGYKYFGTHNWYREGATWLLQTQNGDGSWGGDPRYLAGFNVNNVPVTCFALFFLTRGREAVAFNKAQYDVVAGGKREEARWNQRPRDIAKIVHWIEKKTERDLNWHVVSLKDTPVDELQDAPILYLSGDRKLDLAPEDEAKLKQFAEEGGLILGNPDGDSQLFVESFKALAARLFPMYEMRPLPPDHPIYLHEQFRGDEIHKTDGLLGVSNGVRELMLIPTYDWGKAWQGNRYASRDSFSLADNLYLYVVGRTSFRHGGPGMAHPNPAIATTTIAKIARLDYPGNANPEPAGWQRIAALLHNNEKIDLQVQFVKLGDGTLASAAPPKPSSDDFRQQALKHLSPDQLAATGGDPAKFQALVSSKIAELDAQWSANLNSPQALPVKLAHLTGTTKITLTSAQRQEIKNFINRGGTLLIDAAGGSAAFNDSMEKEMLAIFPVEGVQIAIPIPKEDPLYAGANIDFRYRRYLREGERIPAGPDLRGIKINNRWAVLFSHQDISNALLGRDVDGVIGYNPVTATALVTSLVKQFAK